MTIIKYPLERVVFDLSIYPRRNPDFQTAKEYAEALTEGATFPPVIVEADTFRLLDGRHRWMAHAMAGMTEIDVEVHTVPTGVPEEVYAAELSMANGLRISAEDRREVVRRHYFDGGDQVLKVIAKRWNVANSTVSGYVSDLREDRLQLRRAQSVILNTGAEHGGPGWTQRAIAEKWGIKQHTLSDDIGKFKTEISDIPESEVRGILLSAAADLTEAIPDLSAVIRHIVEQPLEDKAAEALAANPEWMGYIARVPDEFRNYREALKEAQAADAKYAKRVNDWLRAEADWKRKRKEGNVREAGRLRSFLTGYDQAYSMRGHPIRDEVLAELNSADRKRFITIEGELTWPTTRL